MTLRVKRATLLVIGLLGFVGVANLWVSYAHKAARLTHYVETSGRVRSFRTVEEYHTDRSEPNRYYLMPTFEYNVGGRLIAGEPPFYSSTQFKPLKIGDTVPIYYDPEDPARYVPLERTYPPITPGICTALFLIFLTVSWNMWKE